jgi:hypothetical protein
MEIVFAPASIEFFDELGDRLEGLFWERAMMRIAFHWLPIRSRPWVGIRRRAAPLLRCHHRSVATMAPPGKLLDDRVRRLEHRRGDFDPKAGGDAGVENHRHL